MSELFAAFGVNWKLLLVQAVNFGVLLLILWWVLYRPLLAMIDTRKQKIEEGVRASEEAHKRLAQSKETEAEILARAAREGESLVGTAKERAEVKGAQIVEGAEARAQNIFAEAVARSEELQRRAMKQSEKDITKAALLAAEKLLRAEK